MQSLGPCKKCGEELFWDKDENRIGNPATMLPNCCVHEAPAQKKRGAPFKRQEEKKKQFATRLNPASMAWLDERKAAGFKKATTVEAAIEYYKNFLEAEGD